MTTFSVRPRLRRRPTTSRSTTATAGPSSPAVSGPASGCRRRVRWPRSWASRGCPAVYAFEQLLHEGYIEGTGGLRNVREGFDSGRAGRRPLPAQPQTGRIAEDARASRAVDRARLAPLRVSLPALDRFPVRLWSKLVAKHARQFTVEQMAYGDPAGYVPLREAVADYLRTARAVRCEADQVLIVSGSQMALQITALSLLGRGSTVCIEEPGYPGAHAALTRGGARDRAGAGRRRRDRRRCVGREGPKGARGLRHAVASVSARRVDDGLAPAGASRMGAADRCLDHRGRLRQRVSLRQPSPRRAAGHRHGLARDLHRDVQQGALPLAAPRLSGRAATLWSTTSPAHRESIDLFSPVLEQAVLAEFLRDGHFGRHLRRMRALYEKRCDALVRGLREHAAGLVPHNSDAGLHVTAFLPNGIDDRVVVREAARRGVEATALSTCYAGEHAAERSRARIRRRQRAAHPRRVQDAGRSAARHLGRAGDPSRLRIRP